MRKPALALLEFMPAWRPVRTEREKFSPLPRIEVPTRWRVRRAGSLQAVGGPRRRKLRQHPPGCQAEKPGSARIEGLSLN